MTGFEVFMVMTAIFGVAQAERARDERQEAQEIQTGQEDIRNRNEKVRQVREARVATARAQQAANSYGVSGSSLDSGGSGSIQTQAASNVASINSQASANRAITGKLNKAQGYQTSAANVQAIGGMFNTFNNAGMFSSAEPVNVGAGQQKPPQQNTNKYIYPPQQ